MKGPMKAKVHFKGDMVVMPTDAVIVLFTRAEFLAALRAEQRRRWRLAREARVPLGRRGGE
jgi:hypothetical protein